MKVIIVILVVIVAGAAWFLLDSLKSELAPFEDRGIVITVGIMAWVGGVLEAWLGPESLVGKALSQMGLQLVTDPTVASILGWGAVLLAIWLLGALLKWIGKKRFEIAFSAAMERIPLVNLLYKPVAQVVDLLQRKPTDTVEGMSVVYCSFGQEGSGGFLGLLVSDRVYRFNGQQSGTPLCAPPLERPV